MKSFIFVVREFQKNTNNQGPHTIRGQGERSGIGREAKRGEGEPLFKS